MERPADRPRSATRSAAAVGPERLIAITGNDALTGFTAPKLVWVRDHEPEVWARVAHVLLPKDYVRLRLTGEYALDKADGAGTHPVRPRGARLVARGARRARDRPGVDAADATRARRSPGVVTAAAAAATGLRAGTPVVAGGGDQAANAVGVGAVDAGRRGALARDVGRRLRRPPTAPLHDPAGQVHAFCHAVPGRWHMMSVMLSAAGSLRWFRDALAPGEDFGRPGRRRPPSVPAGSDGLLFLPYLTGERSPHPDPLARGAFVGLTLGHDRRHLTRAVLEGVAFGLRDGLDLMIAAGMPAPDQIRASGGGTASPLWRQILADVLEPRSRRSARPRARPTAPGVLAAVGAGWFASVEAAAGGVRPRHAGRRARARCRRATREAHALYRELYPALAPTFQRLG